MAATVAAAAAMASPAIAAGGRSWMRGNLIGAGAFGKVNLAVNREDGEVFAVKSVELDQLREGEEAAQVSLSALENEIDILQSLDSQFVVRCLGSDWTEESGKVMRNVYLEYMAEGCLTDFVKQFAGAEMLDEHLIRRYTRSIVQGIDYLHSRGIVHCDIKGKNILVGSGSAKLTDFGSAKRVGQECAQRRSESSAGCTFARVNGTPLWMAPEVVRQDEQGLASDIWSLGCTVVEMATGKAPWSDLANPMVALFQIGCTNEIPAVPASLSAEAHDFLGHCFQRDPRMRWTSAQLLQHPFLTTRHAPKVMRKVAESAGLGSPMSVMQFPGASECSSGFSSVFRNSVPILAMPSFLKRGLVSEAKAGVGECEEQERGRGSSSRSPFQVPSACEWIVVRSPLGSPRSSGPACRERVEMRACDEKEEGAEAKVMVIDDDGDVEEESSRSSVDEEHSSSIGTEVGGSTATSVNDDVRSGSRFFSWEQCSGSIRPELAREAFCAEGGVLSPPVGVCTEVGNEEEEEVCRRGGREEAWQRCELLEGEDGAGVIDDAHSGRSGESGVVTALMVASTSAEAEGGCDVGRGRAVTTSAIEHGRLCGMESAMSTGRIGREPSVDLEMEINVVVLGDAVQMALVCRWLSWDNGADGHECTPGAGQGWRGSSVDMNVNRDNDVPRKYYCKELLRLHIINLLLLKMMLTICFVVFVRTSAWNLSHE